jgi:DNA primase
VAYAGRALDGDIPKYKLPAGFRKGCELFNIHRAAATSNKTVIVVEGYFDCVRVHQAGFPCVVALMGSSLSASQEKLLREHFACVVLMLDGDAAGRTASRQIRDKLSAQLSVAVALVPEGTQPDQQSPSAIRELVAHAMPEASG